SSSIVRSQTAISASASSFIRRLPYIHQMDIDQRRSQALSTRASAASRETRTATWPRRSPPVAVAGEARSRARLPRRRGLRGVAKPSRHADILELRPRALEQRSRALAIVRAAALEHERLVEVGDRAQRACTLLLEDDAGAGEPLARLAVASRERAHPREREARVDHRVAEVGRHDFLAQAPLDDVAEVRPPDPPERLGGGACHARVVPGGGRCALEGGQGGLDEREGAVGLALRGVRPGGRGTDGGQGPAVLGDRLTSGSGELLEPLRPPPPPTFPTLT